MRNSNRTSLLSQVAGYACLKAHAASVEARGARMLLLHRPAAALVCAFRRGQRAVAGLASPLCRIATGRIDEPAWQARTALAPVPVR